MNKITLSSLIEMVRTIGTKDDLVRIIREELQLNAQPSLSYEKIFQILSSSGKEERFCRLFSKVENFQDLAEKFGIIQSLGSLSKDELAQIARKLLGDENWKSYVKTRIIQNLSERATLDQLRQVFPDLIKHEKIEAVGQRGRWASGPQGVLRSVESRDPAPAQELIDILTNVVGRSHWRDYLANSPWWGDSAKISFQDNDPLLVPKFIQVVLSSATTEQILSTLNVLLQKNIAEVGEVKGGYHFLATPAGVFEARYGGINALTDLLFAEFEEEKLQVMFGKEHPMSADLRSRVVEKCIRDNPEQILGDYFGLSDLYRIARNVGLVCAEKIKDKRELTRLILLALGFDLPAVLQGISGYREALANAQRKLEDPRITVEERNGTMNKVYSETERILKDVLYFFATFIWLGEVHQYDVEGKKDTIDRKLRKEFDIQKTVSGMNFGPLISLTRQLNKRLQLDARIRGKFEKEFGRKSVVPFEHVKVLEEVANKRPFFSHDVKAQGQRKEPDIHECRAMIQNLIDLARDVQESGIYPTFIRITLDSSDEYGRSYLEAFDETGFKWLIKSDAFMSPGKAYYMHSRGKAVAVDPFLVAKYW